MKISVIGTGYVGLVSGVCFAEIGHDVTCIDIRQSVIDMLNEGKSPIYEPGLSEMIKRNIRSKKISFSREFDSVSEADAIFLAVGTPSSNDGSADLQYLEVATKTVAENLKKEGSVVVIKSTVPVGTHKKVDAILNEFSKVKYYVANNPEFLKEGSAIADFMKPDRVVIGCKEAEAVKALNELYAPLVRQGHPVHAMDNLSAEMTKYAANAMLATKISFINEISRLCDLTGANIASVRTGIASDKRIGPHFIYAGPGYGGSCFPKDVKALVSTGKDYDYDMKILNAVEEVNETQKTYMLTKILKHYGGSISGKTFAMWGVSFKPNTDDVRESPAVYMTKALVELGAKVKFYDAEGMPGYIALTESEKDNLIQADSMYACIEGVDALILMTEWSEFRSPDFKRLGDKLEDKVIFDTRNIYFKEDLEAYNISLYGIGQN